MKRIVFLIMSIALTGVVSAQYVKYPVPFEQSRGSEPARSEFLSYRSANHAWQNVPDSSKNYSSLDGQWSYVFVSDNSKITDKLFAPHTDLSSWKKVTLPAASDLSDATARKPFTPSAAPVMQAMPEAPKTVESVVLARDFIVPFDYTDRALYLHIGAVSGAMTLYINGQEVGSRTDSKVPSEFNISKFIERGLNRVVIQVDRWSDAQYVERSIDKVFTGISRPVYLFAQPKIRVFDIMMKTSLDPTYTNGLLEIAMLLKTELLNPHTVTVYYDLYDPQGKLVNQEFKEVTVEMRVQDTVRFTASIINVDKWSHENPALYTVMFRIKREGRFTEYVTRKVGFRTIDIKNSQLLINGRNTPLHGVNADMFGEIVSDATDTQTLLQNLRTLKYAGVNAIRTPYPLGTPFYDMCDSLGIYVVNLANINSKGFSLSIMKGGTLANNPAWREVFVNRVLDTYEYAKVHPSVIAWGLGEDAGNGYCMYQAYNALRKRETTRPIVYDGADMEWNTDICMPQYPDTEKTALQPTIPARTRDVKAWDTPSGAFLSTPSTNAMGFAKSLDAKHAGVMIHPIDLQKGTFEITNNLRETNLSAHPLIYTIYNTNGKVQKNGIIELNVAPGQSAVVEIPGTGEKKIIEIKIGTQAYYTNR